MADDVFYITTPIYYVNGSPHFAHAYTSVAADVLARFHRLDGKRVYFLTGTDEHGQKVEQAARAAGLDPQRFCDSVSEEFREMGQLMNVSNDDFIRTTQARHIKACQALWRELQARGQIYLGEFAGWYSVRDEAFYEESELVDGRAPTGAGVEWVKEPNYFFRLSAYADRLLVFYESHPNFILPVGRRNEVINFVKGGLRDLSISRSSLKWGIPVPGDETHVMYVWLDALTNYVTAVGYPELRSELWRTFWPASVHLVGKDITRFHCVYWPAFLMAAGVEPPASVFAHGWWTVEGQKMSKSLDNFIPPRTLVDNYGVDQVRYFMLRELSFGNDGDFSHQAVVDRINGDLANSLGNLIYRVLTLIARRCDGLVPRPGRYSERDRALLGNASHLVDEVRRELCLYAIHRALEKIWKVVGDANRYIDEEKPWALPPADRLHTILYVLAEAIRHIVLLLQPFMPTSASEFLDQLAVPNERRTIEDVVESPMVSGQSLPAPRIIFRRSEDSLRQTKKS